MTTDTKKSRNPYKDRGIRLRRRRESLQSAGRLPSGLLELAKQAGVSVSGFQQWERGETWPRDKKKENLARMMGWTLLELDYGPQEPREGSDMFHPLGPKEVEVIALYRALAAEPSLQGEALQYLRAKVASLHVFQQEVRGPVQIVSDQDVAKRLPPAPKEKKGAKHKL